MKAFVRVDDKKELIAPPRIQEKEFKEPERISLRTPKDLELKKQSKSLFFSSKIYPKNLIITPAATAEPITPAIFGPIACINK